MRNTLLKLYVKKQVLWNTIKEENGQDLVEYAAVICIVILGLVSGMNTLADQINNAMTGVGAKVNNILGS